MPSGSVLSRKWGVRRSPASTERVRHELRPEGGPADADDQQVAEALGARRLHPAVVHAGGEVQDAGPGVADGGRDLRRGRLLRRPQPVVADHAVLVGVGDRPALERLHGIDRGLDRSLALGEGRVAEPRAAQVEPHPETGVVEQQGLVALPELAWGHGVSSSSREPHSTAAAARRRAGPVSPGDCGVCGTASGGRTLGRRRLR